MANTFLGLRFLIRACESLIRESGSIIKPVILGLAQVASLEVTRTFQHSPGALLPRGFIAVFVPFYGDFPPFPVSENEEKRNLL